MIVVLLLMLAGGAMLFGVAVLVGKMLGSIKNRIDAATEELKLKNEYEQRKKGTGTTGDSISRGGTK